MAATDFSADGRTEGGGVAVGEDLPVGADQPVALARRRRRHAGDRLGQGRATGGTEEGGVAEGEDAAVGGHHPVALARWPTAVIPVIGLFSLMAPVEPKNAGVTEGEDAAVGGHQPVALARRGGRHAHDRLVQLHRSGRAEEAGVTEGEDARRPTPPASSRCPDGVAAMPTIGMFSLIAPVDPKNLAPP